MGLVADLRVLSRLVFARGQGADHAARLESFYHSQAGDYDDFRKRLLHGREVMMTSLDLPEGGRLLDLGGGTGSNLEVLGDKLKSLREVTVVDLSESLLKVADERIQRHGWSNVRTLRADATTYAPSELVDVVTFSYSLTMIPDWFKAIDRAIANLKPGGVIGVVDFHVSRKWPAEGRQRHGAFTRAFWPTWFGWDNVYPSSEHIPYLQDRLHTLRLEEGFGKVPYLLGLKAPYYVFVGRKTAG